MGRTPVLKALGFLTVVLIAVHVAFPEGTGGEITYLGVIVGAGIAAVCGAWHRPAHTRAPWAWIAFGVCLSAMGDVSYALYVHLQGVEPDISGRTFRGSARTLRSRSAC